MWPGANNPSGSGGSSATVYRSLVPYSGLGGTAEQIGFGAVSHTAVGSSPEGAYPVRDAAGMIVDTATEPAPLSVATSGPSNYLFQTYVHTTCTTNAPSFPDGSCYGVSFTLQFGSRGTQL